MSIWDVLPILLTFVVVFPLMFGGVILLIAQLGGWAAMARRYRDPRPNDVPPGAVSLNASGRLGLLGSYNGVLIVIVAPDGLRLRAWGPFRLGHAPLFAPWSAVASIEVASLGLMVWTRLRFVEGAPRRRMQLNGRDVADAVRGAAPADLFGGD